jgi:hypothetical protein
MEQSIAFAGLMPAAINSYRSIWISDVHLGTRGCKAEALLHFLRQSEAENLFLVGDIVDGWNQGRSWYWSPAQRAVAREIARWLKRRVNSVVRYLTEFDQVRDSRGLARRGYEHATGQHADGHDHDRSRRLPAAFLDRAPAAVSDLRHSVRAQEALRMGHSPHRAFRASGMIVRPGFYEPARISRAAARRRIGLEPDVPTGLVMFGGDGSRRMASIAARVAAAGLKTQLVFICGHSQQLRDQLIAMRVPFPHHIEGFTPDIVDFMRLANFFIGKPGPGSISEALVIGLPLIIERNALTMVQERYNTEWIAEHGLGLVLRSFSVIAPAVERMLNPAELNGFRARVGALENRAVFEIPEIIELLMAGRPNDLRAGAEASVN